MSKKQEKYSTLKNLLRLLSFTSLRFFPYFTLTVSPDPFFASVIYFDSKNIVNIDIIAV